MCFNEIAKVINKEGPTETIDGKLSNWLRVNFNGREGYVFGAYVEEINE